MAKIRNNYEKSWFPRLLKWLDGGSGLLDDAMAHELDEGSEEHLLPDSQDALTRETKFEQHRQESLDKDETLYERYHQWAHTRGKKLLTWLYRLLAVVVCFSIIWVLLQTAATCRHSAIPTTRSTTKSASAISRRAWRKLARSTSLRV